MPYMEMKCIHGNLNVTVSGLDSSLVSFIFALKQLIEMNHHQMPNSHQFQLLNVNIC